MKRALALCVAALLATCRSESALVDVGVGAAATTATTATPTTTATTTTSTSAPAPAPTDAGRTATAAPLALDGFTPEELRAAQKLSPLPPPPPDPTNRVADDPRAARLGQFLFFDGRLSASGAISCATCHRPELAFTDGRPLGDAGAASGGAARPLDRHTPTLLNSAQQRWWFWDGRADSLWAQALHPLEEPREHASSRLAIAHLLHDDAALRRAYEALFGPLPDLADRGRFPPAGRPGEAAYDAMAPDDRLAIDRLFANVGKALAAYERRLRSDDSPFDRFIADVRAGRVGETSGFGAAEREGLRLFVGAARCVRCHSGPNFTDREFHDNRVPTRTGDPRRDPGRQRGIPLVQDDPFNGAGRHSDAPEGAAAEKLRYLPRMSDSFGHMKTPTLRDVARTAPYMHQGQFATLDEVLAYYDTLERAVPTHSPERTLTALRFTPEQLAALRAFLESLSGAPLDPALLAPPPSPELPP
ncbi:MAG: hypothetical protein JNL90_14810 [Planctomycetes bacterium]|nr:hypothetical protein [Planctomycetota bacterium]